MRIDLLALLILLAAPAAAQDRGEGEEPSEAIIVTGIRIQDYRDRLAACLARNCPPDEDADATLALAEALFLEGDYDQARGAVHASLGRNRNRARDYPEPVSDLYRAHARLSRHMGEDRDALRSTHGILNALQQGIPAEDHRHFTARIELAEVQMMMGRWNGARRELDRLRHAYRGERAASRCGRLDLRALRPGRGLERHRRERPHLPRLGPDPGGKRRRRIHHSEPGVPGQFRQRVLQQQ